MKSYHVNIVILLMAFLITPISHASSEQSKVQSIINRYIKDKNIANLKTSIKKLFLTSKKTKLSQSQVRQKVQRIRQLLQNALTREQQQINHLKSKREKLRKRKAKLGKRIRGKRLVNKRGYPCKCKVTSDCKACHLYSGTCKAGICVIGQMAGPGVNKGTQGDQGDQAKSIDEEAMKLQRMLKQRDQVHSSLRQAIDKYNETAEEVIQSLGRDFAPPKKQKTNSQNMSAKQKKARERKQKAAKRKASRQKNAKARKQKAAKRKSTRQKNAKARIQKAAKRKASLQKSAKARKQKATKRKKK